MIIISFDIGIKNLAYSLCEYTNNILNCLDWKIVNLIEIPNCCDNKNVYFINNIYKCLKCLKFKEKFKCSLCDNKTTFFRIQDKNYCNKHGKNILVKFKVKKENTKKLNINDIKIKIIELLENNFKNKDINIVLIENQPTFKNPQMKTISNVIHDYFIIRNFDKIFNINQIKFLSPSNKLKLNMDFFNEVKQIKNSTEKYKLTKKYAIDICNKYQIQYNISNEFKEYFKQHKKQDDLSDCFLQIIYFINFML